MATGYDGDRHDYSQVVDMSSTESCSNLDSYPLKLDGATGGLVNGDPLICGGIIGSSPSTSQSSCYKYERSLNEWTLIANMNNKRSSHSSCVTTKGLFITGGWDENENRLDSTEYVSTDGVVTDGPKLPAARSHHCMVTLHDGKVMVIGGYPSSNLKSMIIFDPEDNTFDDGPDLNYNRDNAGCTIFRSTKHKNRNVVLAAGGWRQYTAEILDYTNPNANAWEESKYIYQLS